MMMTMYRNKACRPMRAGFTFLSLFLLLCGATTLWAQEQANEIACSSGTACKSGFIPVAKLNPDGWPKFATCLGGSGEDTANAIALDSVGNIYIPGATASTDFHVISAAQYGTGGVGDAFVAELAGDGTRVLYATNPGGADKDEVRGIAVDANFKLSATRPKGLFLKQALRRSAPGTLAHNSARGQEGKAGILA